MLRCVRYSDFLRFGPHGLLGPQGLEERFFGPQGLLGPQGLPFRLWLFGAHGEAPLASWAVTATGAAIPVEIANAIAASLLDCFFITFLI